MAGPLSTTWVPDHAGIATFEERDPQVNATIAAEAKAAVAHAKRIAPVGSAADED